MCPKTTSSYVCIGHSSQNIPLPYTTQTGSWNLVGSTRQLINIYWDSTDFIDEILSSFICGIGAGLYTSIRSCQLFVMACGVSIFCYQTWYLWIFSTFSKKGYEIVISREKRSVWKFYQAKIEIWTFQFFLCVFTGNRHFDLATWFRHKPLQESAAVDNVKGLVNDIML